MAHTPSQSFGGALVDLYDVFVDWKGRLGREMPGLVSALRAVDAERVLDLGCGLGRTAVAFAAHYARVDAVDISPEMIQRAGALDPPPNIHFALNSGTDLQPFADDRFDLVFSMLVFQHIPGDAVVIAYLAEINRVLRRGGHAVLQFDTRPPTVLSRLYERLPTLLPGGTHGRYIRRYRRRADRLREMIAAAGLEIVDDVHPETAEHLLLLAQA